MTCSDATNFLGAIATLASPSIEVTVGQNTGNPTDLSSFTINGAELPELEEE
jgi:hypothetical protein